MIRKVPTTEILKNLDESCDYAFFDGSPERWQELIFNTMTDGCGAYVLHSILEEGQLDPINITNGHVQGNGHHRLAALILLGADEILVDDSDWYSPDSDAHRREPGHVLRDWKNMPQWCRDDSDFLRDQLDWPAEWITGWDYPSGRQHASDLVNA